MQYHHIIPWETEHHFRAEDMIALCPNDHVLANDGAIPVEQQREAKANPWNRQHGFANGLLYVNQTGTTLQLGGSTFQSVAGDLLRVDDETLIATALSGKGTLLLSVRLFDESDRLIAEIVENEWISHKPLPWDIEFAPQRLHVREASRKIALAVDCKADPVVIRGVLWRAGKVILASRKSLRMGGARIEGALTVVNGAIRLASDQGGFTLLPMEPTPAQRTKAQEVMERVQQRQQSAALKSRGRKPKRRRSGR